MATRSQQVPSTPRVISPTPTPSESGHSADKAGYFAPTTRSAAAAHRQPTEKKEKSRDETEDADEAVSSDSSVEKRARLRSRSPATPATAKSRFKGAHTDARLKKSTTDSSESTSPKSNGHLSPSSATSIPGIHWRSLSPSRSPSPLGLIPIHRHWRSIIHKHEIPRKALHVSIGFVTLYLYSRGTTTSVIHPWLLGALIPIASVDYARHTFPGLNRFYVRSLGALMRESEVDGYNGVIWYLLGAWTVLRFLPKDVGVMSVLLLSWCDTAASTFGRLYGRYTPRIRRGKSLAGSAAAVVVGMMTASLFWGWAVPTFGHDTVDFQFRGQLVFPRISGISKAAPVVTGWVALGIVSLWSGLVASASEAIDLWGWDDNATIPILSGLGLWGFFKVFAV